MANKVLYTSIVGAYDKLHEPDIILDDWDYICFSNDYIPSENSVWQIRPIPPQSKDHISTSRFVKINPHIVLKDYRYSLWIDGNVIIKGNYAYSRAEQLIKQGELISIPKHPLRDCTFEEAAICIKIGKEYKSIIKEQMQNLKENGFPENIGLFEGNIIFRNHLHKDIIELDEDWWNEFTRYSKRDQLSLRYVLWKNQINCIPFFEEGYNVRNHPDFAYPPHRRTFKHKLNKRIRIIKNKFT